MTDPADEPPPEMLPHLFRSLAHDLRSPLGVVSEALNEISTNFQSQLSGDQQKLLVLAGRGMRRVERLADMLSLLSSLEEGTFVIRPAELDLGALTRDVLQRVKSLEPRRELEIECELSEGPWLVHADPVSLGAALLELLSNGVRHARGRVRVQIERADGDVRLVLEDDGRGVPAERRPDLFRRFVSRSHGRVGLGLSIAHDVLVAHGGRLSLEDSTLPPGRPGSVGARFIAVIPVKVTDPEGRNREQG